VPKSIRFGSSDDDDGARRAFVSNRPFWHRASDVDDDAKKGNAFSMNSFEAEMKDALDECQV
jgi:hypothetical protein